MALRPITNYWVFMSRGLREELWEIIGPPNGPLHPLEPAVMSTDWPRLNFLTESLKQMLRREQAEIMDQMVPPYHPQAGGVLWLHNGYIEDLELGEMTVDRELLQQLAGFYPSAFAVAGAWDYYTGEPIGGVGSPWFQMPADYAEKFPEAKVPDLVLRAGQAPRIFI